MAMSERKRKKIEKLYYEGIHLALTPIGEMGKAINAIPWWKRQKVLAMAHTVLNMRLEEIQREQAQAHKGDVIPGSGRPLEL